MATSNALALFPCYLNDFSNNWNADKVCDRGKPHDWLEEKGWKTSAEENQFFSTVLAYAYSIYVFDTVYRGGLRDYTSANRFHKVKDKGFAIVARALINWKYENHA